MYRVSNFSTKCPIAIVSQVNKVRDGSISHFPEEFFLLFGKQGARSILAHTSPRIKSFDMGIFAFHILQIRL